MITRRGLLGGMASLLAAPAIVRVSSLMALPPRRLIRIGYDIVYERMRDTAWDRWLRGEDDATARRMFPPIMLDEELGAFVNTPNVKWFHLELKDQR